MHCFSAYILIKPRTLGDNNMLNQLSVGRKLALMMVLPILGLIATFIVAETELEGLVDLVTMEEWLWQGEDLGTVSIEAFEQMLSAAVARRGRTDKEQ